VQTGAESEDQTSQNATQTTDESVVKTWSTKKQKNDTEWLIHFKNSRNATLSFIWPDWKLCSFTNGIFATNDPATIKKLELTQDFKFGFIKEFDPEKQIEKSK
jgi:hypothetical protein